MKQFHALIIFITLCVFLTGCKTDDPNPELKDPIYRDLVERFESHKKKIETVKKEMDELSIALAKAEPHSLELKNARRDMALAKDSLLNSEQWERYYRIRSERRRVVARVDYRAATQKGENWPDPREYSDYLVNTRMREIQLNWNARVPKLQARLGSSRSPANSEKKSAEGESAAAKSGH